MADKARSFQLTGCPLNPEDLDITGTEEPIVYQTPVYSTSNPQLEKKTAEIYWEDSDPIDKAAIESKKYNDRYNTPKWNYSENNSSKYKMRGVYYNEESINNQEYKKHGYNEYNCSNNNHGYNDNNHGYNDNLYNKYNNHYDNNDKYNNEYKSQRNLSSDDLNKYTKLAENLVSPGRVLAPQKRDLNSEDSRIIQERIIQERIIQEDYELNLKLKDRMLPLANISKIMKRSIPLSGKIAKDAKDLIQRSASEFIAIITCRAKEICESETRKTVTGEDLIKSMEDLDLPYFAGITKKYFQQYKNISRFDRSRRSEQNLNNWRLEIDNISNYEANLNNNGTNYDSNYEPNINSYEPNINNCDSAVNYDNANNVTKYYNTNEFLNESEESVKDFYPKEESNKQF